MAGGFAKDAFGDMLVGIQRRLEAVERQSSSGKILPCDLTLADQGGAIETQPTIFAEYYRHADFVQCWFAMQIPVGFALNSGAFLMSTPWALSLAPGHRWTAMVGQWRASQVNTGQNATGQIYAGVTGDDPRLWFWYTLTPPIGTHQWVGNGFPWVWAAGDVFQGEFRGHIQAGG